MSTWCTRFVAATCSPGPLHQQRNIIHRGGGCNKQGDAIRSDSHRFVSPICQFFWGLNEAGLAAANSPMPLPGKESWRVCRKSRAAGCPRRGPRCLQCAWSSHLSPSPGHGLWGFQLVNPSRGGWRTPKMCQVASREHLLARRLREDLNKRLD